MDKNKLVLAVSILLGCIILGGLIYATQVIKQRSIEKQQLIELRMKAAQDQVKAEQDKKEYVVKRKKDCYDLETSERKKWNNVDGSYYDEQNDVCVVRYVNEKWREGSPNSCDSFSGLYTFNPFLSDKKSEIPTCTINHYFTNEF